MSDDLMDYNQLQLLEQQVGCKFNIYETIYETSDF